VDLHPWQALEHSQCPAVYEYSQLRGRHKISIFDESKCIHSKIEDPIIFPCQYDDPWCLFNNNRHPWLLKLSSPRDAPCGTPTAQSQLRPEIWRSNETNENDIFEYNEPVVLYLYNTTSLFPRMGPHGA
jgi:hypothetical protein